MKKISMILTIVTLGIFIIILEGCDCCKCKPALIGSQPVTLRAQETGNWCWAATTQMITEFLEHGRTQCDLANERFARNDCCTSGCPKNAACNIPGWTMFTECGFTYSNSSTPLTWEKIKFEIYCAKKPLSFAYGPKSGGVGHVLVIYGYAEIGDDKFLSLKDPWSPCNGTDRFITYQEYSNSATHNHWETAYSFKYTSE